MSNPWGLWTVRLRSRRKIKITKYSLLICSCQRNALAVSENARLNFFVLYGARKCSRLLHWTYSRECWFREGGTDHTFLDYTFSPEPASADMSSKQTNILGATWVLKPTCTPFFYLMAMTHLIMNSFSRTIMINSWQMPCTCPAIKQFCSTKYSLGGQQC